MPFDIFVMIVQGLPESLVFIFLIYAILGARVSWTRVVLLGLLHFSLIMAARGVGAPFPAHTLLALVLVSVVISMCDHIALYRVLYAWVFAMVILILSETGLTMLTAGVVGIPAGELATDPWLWAMVGLPHVAVMALVAWWAHRRGGVRPFRVTAGTGRRDRDV